MRYIIILFLLLVITFLFLQHCMTRLHIRASSYCCHIRDLYKAYNMYLNAKNDPNNESPIIFCEKTLSIIYNPDDPKSFIETMMNSLAEVTLEYRQIYSYKAYYSIEDWKKIEVWQKRCEELVYLVRNEAWKLGKK